MKIIFKMVSTHLAVLPMNMVSQDTDTDVALPYYSGAIDMLGYYTVLGMDIWYSIAVFLNFVRTRPGKFFFHNTRAQSQQICS